MGCRTPDSQSAICLKNTITNFLLFILAFSLVLLLKIVEFDFFKHLCDVIGHFIGVAKYTGS